MLWYIIFKVNMYIYYRIYLVIVFSLFFSKNIYYNVYSDFFFSASVLFVLSITVSSNKIMLYCIKGKINQRPQFSFSGFVEIKSQILYIWKSGKLQYMFLWTTWNFFQNFVFLKCFNFHGVKFEIWNFK